MGNCGLIIGYSIQTSPFKCKLFFILVLSMHAHSVLIAALMISGENAIVIVGGANQTLHPEEVQRAKGLVAGAKVVICQLEISPETTLAALKLAKDLGGKDEYSWSVSLRPTIIRF